MPPAVVADAIEIGARVLDREQTGAQRRLRQGGVRARGAASSTPSFVRAAPRAVAERLDAKVDEASSGRTAATSRKALERHFGDELGRRGAAPGPRRGRPRSTGKMREDLRRQFSSDGREQPAGRRSSARRCGSDARPPRDQQDAQLRAMNARLAGLREELAGLQRREGEARGGRRRGRARAPRRGAPTRRTVAAGARRARPAAGRRRAGRRRPQRESTGKKGDVVVAIGACHGPAQGRIVFEAKDRRLSRPRALAGARRLHGRAQRRLRRARRPDRRRGARADAPAARVQRRQARRRLRPRATARWRCRSPTRWPGPAC